MEILLNARSIRFSQVLAPATIALAALLSTSAFAAPRLLPPLQTVAYVDLAQYSGLWYEISHAFAPYEKDCVGTTATYTPLADGSVGVLNACYTGSFDGPLFEIEGVAQVVDPRTNAKLAVSFDAPTARQAGVSSRMDARYLEGNYWIIDLGTDYEYAVVSNAYRTSFWVLSRTATMDDETYDAILTDLEADGFDTSKLKLTDQTP